MRKGFGTWYESGGKDEYRTQQKIEIGGMQFGFMKDKGMADVIFIVRQMQEKFRVKENKLCFADTSHSSTARIRIAHLIASLRTLSKGFFKFTKYLLLGSYVCIFQFLADYGNRVVCALDCMSVWNVGIS